MSGPKAYTMREMKGIVEYLVENKAYSEIRGRKMWVDFANSSRTSRTWQSLKETFLKRILTDIHNPYYHLTRDQVCSFKQGVDVEAKERNNKLEIRTVSEGSTSNVTEKQNDIEQPCTSAEKPNEAEKTLGEKVKSAAITVRNRSSADTFIIDEETESRNSRDDPPVSKKTTEELLEDLGEPSKSLKECLAFEYSEPPCAVREVINDFETESEDSDKEPQMEIVEDTSVSIDAGVIEEVIVVDSENMDIVELADEDRILVEGGMEVDIGPTFDHEIITEVTSTDLQGINNWLEDCAETVQKVPENESAKSVVQETTAEENEGSSRNESREEIEAIIVEESEPIIVEDSENVNRKTNEKEKKKPDSENNNLSSLNATADTIIPNNQEVLDATTSQRTSGKFDILAPLKNASQKRSTSPDKIVSKKKKLDCEAQPKTNGNAIEVTPPSSDNTEAVFEALKKADKPVQDSEMQDAQHIDEAPQNKNPCLKSVSLFEEQFNTTKYSDSEEDTPIPNNEVKIKAKANTTTAEGNQSKIVKESLPNDNKEKITDPSMEQTQKEVVETNPAMKETQLQKETDPLAQAKQKKAVEEKHDETTKSDGPVQKNKDIILLKSDSDSDVRQTTTTAENPKESYYKNLAHAFGFVPGTSRTTQQQRKRSMRSRNRTKSQRSCNAQEDSDWESSLSDPEADGYISPPRGRRNKYARRYRKPTAGRVMSLDEEGGLFVVHGNKIFPLVKNGKILNFVTYNALDDSEEEEESIWIRKLKEEKRKAALLKRKLEEMGECQCRSKSPRLPNPSGNIATSAQESTHQQASCSQANRPENNRNKQCNSETPSDTAIHVTLTTDKESVNFRGNWQQIYPAIQDFMPAFYKKDAETTSKPDVPIKTDVPIKMDVPMKDEDREVATPIIPIIEPETRKVDEIECKIFKEIEEQDKIDETNVTKRKAGRPKKTLSTSSEQSEKSAKRPRRSKQNDSKDKAETQTEANKMADEKVITTKIDLTRLSSDIVVEPAKEKPKVKVVSAKAKKQAQDIVDQENKDTELVKEVVSPKAKKQAQDIVDQENKDTELVKEVVSPKVKKPSQAKVVKEKISKESVDTPVKPIEPRVTRSRKSGNDTDTSTRTSSTRQSSTPKVTEEQVRYMFPPEPMSRRSTRKLTPNKTTSSEKAHETSQGEFRTSVDSSQGYQDSDPSPAKVNITKRKRKTSITVRKGKYVPRRKSLPTLTVNDMSLDSSNSFYFVPKKLQSSLDSAVYKTESYEILMGNRKHSIKKLNVIDESSKSDELGHYNTGFKESSNNSNIVIEVGSSSNVSLPLSPELSVVENLSISREMIQSDKHPTINETQANNSFVNKIYDQYLISDVDVSMPLMQQDCELVTSRSLPKSKLKKQKTPVKVSDLLSKVSVNMSLNNTLSDSLDRKLRDLLLESAQKITNYNKENLMDVDESNVPPKKTKKRCSTPRKRANTKQAKPAIGPVIDEHMESCSHGGRNSCPPVITFIPIDENANNSADVQLQAKPKQKPPRVKKDIIKVKIQRPKNAKKGAKVSDTMYANTSQISVYTDSGINETASISEENKGNDSVELIHNHSETCLQANECIGNSIEFVENSTSESVISVNSTVSLENELLKVMDEVEILSGRLCGQPALDFSGENSSEEIYGTPAETVYHSPLASNCSLITEDLSNETPAKWYLFSEDDTNNTNMRPEQMTSNTRVSNFTANLKQLFPITCAVPDLSTISEISKENEGSRKDFDMESDTRSSSY